MKIINLNNKKYKVIKNVRDALSVEDVASKLTDYFDEFDYIVGDIAYNKLRLKGFNNKNNKNYKPINDIDRAQEYIDNNCAFGCRWFIISEIKELNNNK